MISVQDLIRKKRDGQVLSREEIEFLIGGISSGEISDYQISAWAMAVYFQGMDERETRDLAVAMANSGDVVDLSSIQGITVDKHSTGGVGDKTTLAVIPLVAAAGIPVAKMSGRGLGHTGGTIDKFESIPGMKVEKNFTDFIAQVNVVKAAVISQTGNLVPADKRLYAIRDVTATVDSIPLIASSIMSKKLASGAEGIVLDVKVGSGAFMKNRQQALQLAEIMVSIGKGAGRQVVAILTDMSQPLGFNIGNSLEVIEAVDLLAGDGPTDLLEISLELAAHMMVLGKKFDQVAEARNYAAELLTSGKALDKFMEMITAQGGIIKLNKADRGLKMAAIQQPVQSAISGYVNQLDAYQVGHTAMSLGAGREQINDVIDHSVGIQLLKKRGDYVQAGETIAVIHASQEKHLSDAEAGIRAAYEIGPAKPEPTPLILDIVT